MNGRFEDCSKEALETEKSSDEEDQDIASDYSSTFDFVTRHLNFMISKFSKLKCRENFM